MWIHSPYQDPFSVSFISFNSIHIFVEIFWLRLASTLIVVLAKRKVLDDANPSICVCAWVQTSFGEPFYDPFVPLFHKPLAKESSVCTREIVLITGELKKILSFIGSQVSGSIESSISCSLLERYLLYTGEAKLTLFSLICLHNLLISRSNLALFFSIMLEG